MIGLVELRRCGTHAEARRLELVLTAVGIHSWLVPSGGQVGLCVAAPDGEAAREQLDLYERENAPPPESAASSSWKTSATRDGGFAFGMAYAAILLFLYGATWRDTWAVDWLAVGAAQAEAIRVGAWWRTITALTLHGDHGHLLGNLAAGLAFGPLVARLLGAGLGWLAILLAGALGNGLYLQEPGHTSIGASTALFGALGLLAGHRRRSRVVPWRGGLHRWAPISAGIMMLVYMGTGGERTDVGAHVAGFAVGVLIGLTLAHHEARVPQGPGAQRAYGVTTFLLLALAWFLAVFHGA